MAKTKDVIDAAKEIKDKGNKGICIQELSVVDVSFKNVNILALSINESTLAVSLSHSPDIHFFSVPSLLNKVGQRLLCLWDYLVLEPRKIYSWNCAKFELIISFCTIDMHSS